MKLAWETLLAAVLIAAAVLLVGRYQISAIGSGTNNGNANVVYRLDRWTGRIDRCTEDSRYEKATNDAFTWVKCPASDQSKPQT